MDTGKQDAFLENYRWLARYNRWFNARLYDACERLDDAGRRQDRGAFFGSIHRTLNHLVWADRMWLGRMAALGPFQSLTPGVLALPQGAVHETVLYEDWSELRKARAELDDAIVAWTLEMDARRPLAVMRYANTKGVKREHAAWRAMTHFFNHQAHHRGQVTTLLVQAGVDPGVTDLIALPDNA
ncbi:DinB family protein [Ramlibacter humi]|uniref:Damage-inducible protein DinB n=1 Tax=Ramlibacter humi TaxID=2530451 RepID=A0A4Z0BLV1_9BURK|nr:DinB family protein [Ramlibacter humi]TFZ00306.1 damage-inducible protein DinB [Ramlibacter humi]